MSIPITPNKNQQTSSELHFKVNKMPRAPSKPENPFLLAGVNLRNNDNYFPGLANQVMPSFDFNFSSVNDRGLSSCAVSLKSGMLRKVDFEDLKGLDRMSVDFDDNLIRNDIMKNHEIQNLGKRGFIRMGVEVIPKDLEVCSVALSDKFHWGNKKTKKRKKKVEKKNRSTDKWSREQVFGIVREYFEQEKQKKLKKIKTMQTSSLKDLEFDIPDLKKSTNQSTNKPKPVIIEESGYRMTWESSSEKSSFIQGFKTEVGNAIKDIIQKFALQNNQPTLALDTVQLGSQNDSRFFLTSESGALNSNKFMTTPKKTNFKKSIQNSNLNNSFANKTFQDFQSTNSKTNKKSFNSMNPTTNPGSTSFVASESLINEINALPIVSTKSNEPFQNSTKEYDLKRKRLEYIQEPVFNDNLKIMRLNSKLDKASKFDFMPQLKNVINEIISLIEKNPQKPYSIQQILFYYQMELSLRNCKLIDISKGMKFKIICYSLSSFVDIKMAFKKFEGMGQVAQLNKILKENNGKNLLIDIYEFTKDEYELQNFFFTRDSNRKNFDKKQQLCSFFKKLLMIIVSLLDLMKMFLNFKTGESIYPENHRWEGYKKIVRNIIPGVNKKQLKIDAGLKNQTVSQLLSQIDLRDLQIYISINKSVVKKNKYQDISFRRRDNNQLENIIISYDEHHQLFCPKFKRKDELTKFLFKYIKKQIFLNYKKTTLEKEGKVPYKMIVSNYDSEYLPDKTTRKIFYSENINKKNLILLKKKNSKVTESIIHYVQKSLINNLITKIYQEDEPAIFGNRVTFPEFTKMFLHSSKKHVLLFKDCVIALETLNEVFHFG
jgi:sulfur carrier protein ThiS